MEVRVNGAAIEVEPGTTVLAAAHAAGCEVPTLCFDDRLVPFGACRVCLVAIEGFSAPVAACTAICRDGMVIDTEDAHARRIAANVVELVSRSCPARRRPAPSSPAAAERLGVGTPRWQGATHEPRHDDRHPVSRLPPRAVYLVRALRAHLRRNPGCVCAHRHRTRVSTRTSPPGSTGASAESACVSCGAVRVTCPTGAIAEVVRARARRAGSPGRSGAIVIAERRFDSTTSTTCGYCGVGCRLEAHRLGGHVVAISPAADGPANRGHTCVKGRFAHQFALRRDRLTAPLVREGEIFRLASWDEALDHVAGELLAGQGAARSGCDRRARLVPRDERGLLRDAARRPRCDRHTQHRQLLAGLPLADLLRAALLARVLGMQRLLRRHRALPGAARDRRQPDRLPPGCRRADEAGRAPRHGPRHRRPAPDRARRLRRPPLPAAARNQRRVPQRARPRPDPGRARRRALRRRRGRRATSCSPTSSRTTRRPRSSGSAASPPPTSSALPTSTARRSAASIAWGLGVTEQRHGSDMRPADLQPRAADGQDRPPRLRAAADARPEQRPGLFRHGGAPRHLHRLPLRHRRGDRRAVRSGAGASR